MHYMWPLYNKKFIIINPSVIYMTNFISKIDKKIYLEGSIYQFKNLKWLYYKIEIPETLFTTESNSMVIMHFSFFHSLTSKK